MFQAKYRKVLWAVLTVHLLLVHFWGVGRLWAFLQLTLSYRHPRVFYIKIYPLWFAGTLLFTLWQLYSYQSFRRKALRGMHPIKESWIRGINLQAAEEAGCTRELPLYRSSEVETPMVIGFKSRVLLIPEEEYDSSSLRMILLHEYIHVKNHDVWYKLFFTAGICMVWFQPLLYLLKGAAFRDVEIACDQKVVRGKGEADRSAYGQLLIDSLKRRRSRELPYSAYFYNSRAVMRARLSVVMDEAEHPAYLGALISLLLAAETFALVLTLGFHTAREIRRQQEPEPLVNIYEGYELPESFTAKAVEAMAAVETGEGLGEEYETAALDGPKDVPVIEKQAQGPWQIDNPYAYWRAVPDFLNRYVMYYEDQELGSRREPELLEYMTGGIGVEIRDSTLILGDEEEFVYGLRFRELVSDEERAKTLRRLPGAQSGYEDGYEYLYFEWALHIRKVKENLYELAGVAELKELQEACRGKELSPKYEEFAEIDFWQRPKCRARTWDGVTEVTWDDGKNWIEVPISLDKLTARGDGMEGILTGVQEKSYVVSEEVTAFAYGGSPEVPVTVTCSFDQGVTWNTSVLTYAYPSVRRLFLSFPDTQHGFLVLTCDRTMWQECSILFRTCDGGKTWEEAGIAGPGINQSHSLTTGAGFITPEVGFLTIRSSQDPELYRTADGGETWEWQELSDIPLEMAEDYALERLKRGDEWKTLIGAMGYCMAYPPEGDEEELRLYITMEEYSELGGMKVKYHSEDLGESWILDGYVYRR